MTHRRQFLGLLGRAAATLPLAAACSERGARGASARPIGLQLYTVRDEMQRDFEGTLARVAEIGYQEVEFAGYFGRSPQRVRSALEAAGLRAPAAHVPLEQVRDGWEATLDAARVMGHRYLVVAWLPAEERRSLEQYRKLAALFDRAGEAAQRAGLRFAYHNHDFEFVPLDGMIPYDVLLAQTDPSLVRLEMDLYWTHRADADPHAYFARYPGRFPLVHVKDMVDTPERDMTEVGSGIIDFESVVRRAALAGIEHWFVEHDQPASPFDSVRQSFDAMQSLIGG